MMLSKAAVAKAAAKVESAKAKAGNRKEETPRRDGEGGPDAPLPLLDLSDAAVKKMIKSAKKRGYVTYEQLNAVMPSEEVTSEQIEDTLSMLSEMGINVIEQEDADESDEDKEEDDEEERAANWSKSPPSRSSKSEKRAVRPHRRSRAHVSARNGLGRAALARGRNRDRQAHRGRPRGDDRGPVRKPADLPGHHHLARRTERRKGVAARHHRS